MTTSFQLSNDDLSSLLNQYPNLGKNSHVGNIAVKVVELYFLSQYIDAKFTTGKNGADLVVEHSGIIEKYEIKGTTDKDISWSKLKVSSTNCFDALIMGMILIRVTNIGQNNMELHFLKYGIDFTLIPEPRWSVRPIRRLNPNNNAT